jgi:hypothetical protein
MSARLDAPLYAALDRHVTSRTCHQHALRRPAAPSLVHERPKRTLILKDLLSRAKATSGEDQHAREMGLHRFEAVPAGIDRTVSVRSRRP